MPRKDPDAVRITSATRSHSDELAGRERRYLISMGVRTVCFLLAVVFAPGALMWVFIVASFALPPVAVVLANAQVNTDPDKMPAAFDPHRREIGPGEIGPGPPP